jgi:hypothetical protein
VEATPGLRQRHTDRGEKKSEPDRPHQPAFGLLQRAWRTFGTGAYTKAEIRRLMNGWGLVTRKGEPAISESVLRGHDYRSVVR